MYLRHLGLRGVGALERIFNQHTSHLLLLCPSHPWAGCSRAPLTGRPAALVPLPLTAALVALPLTGALVPLPLTGRHAALVALPLTGRPAALVALPPMGRPAALCHAYTEIAAQFDVT